MLLKKYCFFLLIIFCLNTFAQEEKSKSIDSVKTEKLEEVVISSFHINDSLQNAPASIGILSKKELFILNIRAQAAFFLL